MLKLLVFLVVARALPASAAPYTCRYLNFHRGPAPRVLHAELWCTDADAAAVAPCNSFRSTKVFRFAPGSTAAERRAEMRQEARRYMRLALRQAGCTVQDSDADAATVTNDDSNP